MTADELLLKIKEYGDKPPDRAGEAAALLAGIEAEVREVFSRPDLHERVSRGAEVSLVLVAAENAACAEAALSVIKDYGPNDRPIDVLREAGRRIRARQGY